MRMRTTTDEEREVAQARLESWARGEDTESLRALAEHLAAGQVSSLSRVDVEHYTTTLRTVVDIDIHHAFEVDAEALAAWLNSTERAILWDGVWLDVSNAEDFDHFVSIRLGVAYTIPDTSPIDAHPEHGPLLHIRHKGSWLDCELCNTLWLVTQRDQSMHFTTPTVMTQLQRAILPGATTHPGHAFFDLYALNHEPTLEIRADDGTVNQLWFIDRAFRVAHRNGWTLVEDWIEPAGWTAVFTRDGDTVQISGGPHIRPRQQIENIRNALEDTT